MGAALPLIALLLLGACGKASDGYTFEAKEFSRGAVAVKVVEHPSIGAVQEEAKKLNLALEPGEEVQGFGIVSADRPFCTVHIVDPAISYRPQWLGHEVAHCLYGRWHR